MERANVPRRPCDADPGVHRSAAVGRRVGARRAAGARLGAADPTDAEDAPGFPGGASLGADRRRPAERGPATIRALGEVRPPTAADFFRLAAVQIRRELLDLARRYSGAHGLGANHASIAGRGRLPGPRRRRDRTRRTRPTTPIASPPGATSTARPRPCRRRSARRSTCCSTRGCRRPRRRPSWTSRSARSSADGNRRGCGWSRPWGAGCPASEDRILEVGRIDR